MKDYRARRFPDELANTLTHAFGLTLSVAGLAMLLLLVLRDGRPWHIFSAVLYGLTLLGLFSVSTLYHFTRGLRRRYTLRLLDHCAIYLLIAGSYTPFALIVLPDSLGRLVFILSWLIAAGGIVLKLRGSHRATPLSTLTYLAAGWMCLLVLKPLYERLSTASFALLVAGGLAYTAGTWFFARDRRRFHHAIWHLFVLAGSACHYASIYLVLAADLSP